MLSMAMSSAALHRSIRTERHLAVCSGAIGRIAGLVGALQQDAVAVQYRLDAHEASQAELAGRVAALQSTVAHLSERVDDQQQRSVMLDLVLDVITLAAAWRIASLLDSGVARRLGLLRSSPSWPVRALRTVRLLGPPASSTSSHSLLHG